MSWLALALWRLVLVPIALCCCLGVLILLGLRLIPYRHNIELTRNFYGPEEWFVDSCEWVSAVWKGPQSS